MRPPFSAYNEGVSRPRGVCQGKRRELECLLVQLPRRRDGAITPAVWGRMQLPPRPSIRTPQEVRSPLLRRNDCGIHLSAPQTVGISIVGGSTPKVAPRVRL